MLLRLLELPAKMGFTLHDGEEDTPPAIQIEAAFRIKVNEAAEAASALEVIEDDVEKDNLVATD